MEYNSEAHIETKRLKLYPASQAQMEAIIDSEADIELRKAYTQMLEGCLRQPDQWQWYAMWMIELRDGTHVGDLCFKGLEADGAVEIGYGIMEEYRGHGYATEAVDAAAAWALRQPSVIRVEAETESDNRASQRVLEKCGFLPSGTVGEEGPRFYKHNSGHMDKPVIHLNEPSGSGKPAFAQLLQGRTMAKQRGRYETVSIDDSLTNTAADSTERIYRHCFDKAVLYIHGKGGSAAEYEHYKPLFPGCEVIGLDYQTFTPWETGDEIRAAVEALKAVDKRVILIANSIGAFFSMNAGIDAMIEEAWFISPIVDMEKLITDMMQWTNVTEAELEARGTIHTAFGEDLSWNYLCYVRSHPIRWMAPTRILYGSRDNLTSLETIRDFAKKHKAALTVMEGGEHWFHTEEQMQFLDDWILVK